MHTADDSSNLSGVHSHMWEESCDGRLHGASQDDRQTDGSQAERYTAEAEIAYAFADGRLSGVV
jgi:hypothetical protein